MKKALMNGERLDDVIRDHSSFAPELAQVIAHGQSKSMLSDELMQYSQLLMTRFENDISRWLSMIQPALFAGVGMIIFTMFASILLPIFRLLDAM